MGIFPQRKRFLVLGAILFLGFLVRIIYFLQLKSSPFFYYVSNKLEPQIYYEWAGQIAQGDWLGKSVFPGMPLYAYFLATIFVVFGKKIAAALFIQLLLSCANTLLVFLIAKRLFSERVAFLAGTIAALYLPFLFNDLMLASSVLVTTLNYLALYLLIVFEKKNTLKLLIYAGIVLGFATLARANTLLFLPCVIIWLFIAFRNYSLSKRSLFALCLSLCMFIVILPVTIRNYTVTKEKIFIAPYGGVNFYIGNNPGATGLFSVPNGMRSDSLGMLEDFHKTAEGITGEKMTLAQSSSFWTKNTLGLIRIEPLRYVKLLAKKFFYFFRGFEIPDVMDYYFLKRYAGILNMPFFSFVLIGPLGLLGLILGFKKDRSLALVYIFLVSYTASILLFFVNSRYRLTIVPGMIIFAAFALSRLYDKFIQKDGKSLARAAAMLAVFFIFVNSHSDKINYAQCYNNLGLAYLQQGSLKDSEGAFLRSIESGPVYADAYNNLGRLYLWQGDKEKAKYFIERALRLNPNNPVYAGNMKLLSADPY